MKIWASPAKPLSIECCYLKESGKFEDATYRSLIRLLGWLMREYDLNISDIRRHYDAGGKKCPLYYVEHEDAWEQLKSDVAAKMQNYPKQNAPVG